VSLWVARPWACLATQPLGTILDSSPCVSPDKPQAQDDSAPAANILTRRDTKGHQWTSKLCPTRLWSKIRSVEGSLRGFRGLRGRKIRSGSPKRTRRRFAIFAGCGILLLTSFQPCKGGDMVCARVPLGHLCILTRFAWLAWRPVDCSGRELALPIYWAWKQGESGKDLPLLWKGRRNG
jgi:hypothetical protein